mmetsp:Transcript_35407/g.82229  ORF Transcript_35407/g.82229 Transcript_35407/m.82229 type:complete len:354 (+) Transcript_35407:826-1887(+)
MMMIFSIISVAWASFRPCVFSTSVPFDLSSSRKLRKSSDALTCSIADSSSLRASGTPPKTLINSFRRSPDFACSSSSEIRLNSSTSSACSSSLKIRLGSLPFRTMFSIFFVALTSVDHISAFTTPGSFDPSRFRKSLKSWNAFQRVSASKSFHSFSDISLPQAFSLSSSRSGTGFTNFSTCFKAAINSSSSSTNFSLRKRFFKPSQRLSKSFPFFFISSVKLFAASTRFFIHSSTASKSKPKTVDALRGASIMRRSTFTRTSRFSSNPALRASSPARNRVESDDAFAKSFPFFTPSGNVFSSVSESSLPLSQASCQALANCSLPFLVPSLSSCKDGSVNCTRSSASFNTSTSP